MGAAVTAPPARWTDTAAAILLRAATALGQRDRLLAAARWVLARWGQP